MPWKKCSVMDERLRFVARLLDGEWPDLGKALAAIVADENDESLAPGGVALLTGSWPPWISGPALLGRSPAASAPARRRRRRY